MPTAEKQEKVKELTRQFKDASGAIIAEYRGLTVKETTELRRSLRDAETSFAVVKNTLTKLAAAEAGLEELVGLLTGPTALAFMEGDPIRGAKAVVEATRRFPALVVKGAIIEGRVLEEEQARALATIEVREVSLGKVAGMLQAPVARTVFLLRAPLQRIAFALAERGRQAA
jgi:large subunit ribosomal protein L10